MKAVCEGTMLFCKVVRLVIFTPIALLAIACDGSDPQGGAILPPPVNVALPIEREVQGFDDFTGRVAAVESVEVRSRVAGYIQSIGFKDGEEVKKGQLLIQIDPKPFVAELDQTKAQLAQAEAEFQYADRELKRLEPLAKSGAASADELSKAQDQVARGKASIAKATAEIERRQLDVEYAAVRSPIDGRVSKASLTVGNLVGGDTLLTNVVSVSPVYVNVSIDERRFLQYQEVGKRRNADVTRIRDANLPIFVARSNDKDFARRGVIDFLDNQVDPLTGTILVRAVFDNAQRDLTPGQFVRARFHRGDPVKLPVIPDRAIARDQSRKYVLVVDDKNIVTYRTVETGELVDDERAITSGLKANERIVVDGLQRARPGQPVTPTLIQPATQPSAAK